ncbi:hypothetical protein NU597_004549 [Salmonella enterica]|uniref:Uncharacterized protein n=2 Tax=Epseptimavirus TaxID=2732017 RepID=A0A6G8RHC3_9CAUD|nr:hypothetical protein HOT54_gp036 [Salmonella phage LVR16A]YP_009858540.1 hypothetical protein HWD25_gp101 [Salmonella phage fuchur]EIS1946218.1 hypothetical protein [Salmonella enterica]WDR21949.1 hypothetical protein PJM43_0022 [Salmonella phage vB_SenS_UTK0008]WMM35133.1 hypothetical protein PJFCHJHM_00018 [Salmonella phage EH4]WMT11117.1 hypothetical protein BFINDDAI_00017 [Salmonella phage EH2]WMT11271.1 hypothetical protein BFINDDAO_00017 [Salmonella phage EH5]
MIVGKTKISSAGGDIVTLSSYHQDADTEVETLEYVVVVSNRAKWAELFEVLLAISNSETLPPLTPRNVAHMVNQLGMLWYKLEPSKSNTTGTFKPRREKKTQVSDTSQQASDI